MTTPRPPEVQEVDLRVQIRRIVVRTTRAVAPAATSHDETTGSLLLAARAATTRYR